MTKLGKLFKHISFTFTLSVLFLPALAPAYEYSADEGKWVARLKIGEALMKSKDTDSVAGLTLTGIRDKSLFTNAINAEMEVDYFLFDHFSIGAAVGYQPQNDVSWTDAHVDTGRVTTMPISGMAKFHIAPYGEVRPYVGAGYYYAFMPSSFSYLKTEGTSGPVFAGGLDWWFNRSWGLNLEAKQFIMTTTTDASKLTDINGWKTKSEINPLALTVGLAHRF